MTTHRRRFLRLCGVAGIGGIAGCSDSSGDETPAADQATPTMTETPAATETTTETDAPAQNLAQQAKLAADDGDSGDSFGSSVALSSDGSTALISARRDDNPSVEDAGSAYIFDSTGDSWTQQAKLVADDADSYDFFGSSVTLSSDGSTALVGAPSENGPSGDKAGSAYVFDRSGGSWTQQAKLTPTDRDSYDYFGASVTLSSDGATALIGARGDDDPNGSLAGSAYVFDSAGGSWTQQTKLAPDDGESDDRFGASVTLSSDGATALVGTNPYSLSNDASPGAAYVFASAGDSWTQQAKLAADDGDSNDTFGASVGLSSDGSTALIGAYGDEDPNGKEAGSAYVFDGSGGSWIQQAKLVPDDGDSSDFFGYSVALTSDGATALIGARGDENPNGDDAGSAYVFSSSGGSWTQQAKLAADDGDSEDNFGWSVTLSDDGATALISAEDDEDPNGAGSAYVFA